MVLRRVFRVDDFENALVQTRLNAAALALTALVFSGTFALGLSNELRPAREFTSNFVHLLVTIAIGVVASLIAIICFLQSQEADEVAPDGVDADSASTGSHRRRLYRARHWWFCLGQLALYIALAEALSSSLTEVVYGIWRSSNALGYSVAAIAVPVWWWLLFVGPATLIYRMFWRRRGFVAVSTGYVVVLLAVMLAMGAGYQSRGGGTLWENMGEQFYQPWTWAEDWPQEHTATPSAPTPR